MPRNFSEIKSGGGTIPMLSPHPEKWGGGGEARHPPVPHRTTPVREDGGAEHLMRQLSGQ